MFGKIGAAALAVTSVLCGSAFADDAAYAFKVENASGGAVSVTVDGKSACALAAGGTCTVTLKSEDQHAYAYSLAGATAVSFQPGNLEVVDLCKIDAKGAHCVDPSGTATN
jgi:hypothetical protein